jgi:hypothetical protein
VRGSFPGGCSGAGRLGVSCPRRAGGHRSGGRGAVELGSRGVVRKS